MDDSKAREDIAALENLVADNDDLLELEAILDRFNIFEAVGVARQELRHSDFLAFLLDPRQPHGLGDDFLRMLLQAVLMNNRGRNMSLNLIDLDLMSLEQAAVLREHQNIDILVLDDQNQLAVIIENKVGTEEHSEQLQRYYAAIQNDYPDWRIVALFLTPDAAKPSDDNYMPLSYKLIAGLIDRLQDRRASTIGEDIKLLLKHYGEMLRRHVLNKPQIQELCQGIYRKHQRALDLILEYRPTPRDLYGRVAEKLIAENSELTRDKCSSGFQSFVVSEWDDFIPPVPGTPGNWSSDGRVLVFWFDKRPDRVRVILEILPGLSDLRTQLFQMAHRHSPPFRPSKNLAPSYSRIWRRELLSRKAFDRASDEGELEQEIRKNWQQFLEGDLPKIQDIIKQEFASIKS